MSDSIVVTGWGMVTPLGLDSEVTWKALMKGEKPAADLSGPDWENFEGR